MPLITEKDVWNAVPQRDDSFITQYLAYGEGQNGGFLGYTLGCALALLAIASPQNHKAGEGVYVADTYPNMYILCLGPSGTQKSVSFGPMHWFMDNYGKAYRAADPISDEALSKQLARQGRRIFIYDELGAFFANSVDGARRNPIRVSLTQWYDCRGDRKEYAEASKCIEIVEPRPTLIGACTPIYVERYTDQMEWEGGFGSRLFTIHGHPERKVLRSAIDRGRRDWLAAKFLHAIACTTAFPCLGFEGGDEGEAWKTWASYVDYTIEESRRADPRVSGCLARAALQAAKCHLLLGLDFGGALIRPWWITKEIVDVSIRITEIHWRSVLSLATTISPTDGMRKLRDVVRAIEDAGQGQPAHHAEALKRATMGAGEFKAAIETLMQRGEVRKIIHDGRTFYQVLVPEVVTWQPEWSTEQPGPPRPGLVIAR